ncbi:MAG: potassium transporter Kef [Rickettsiales bacterium]|nr:potassium transporter Kef [Rickettsiales bacterium]OUV98929.1 MAG: hypothetical protein CBD16_09245 [Betaproteobacteria bacterium TMED156]
MDFILLFFFATVFGLLFSLFGLPAMIGFLFAGFICNFFSISSPTEIEFLSNIGINLLLFTIGLKLKIASLLKKEVYGTAFAEVILSILIISSFLFLGNNYFFSESLKLSNYGILFIAFALSFSSTVYSVKILQQKGDITAFYGQTVIGILIIQDLLATLFLAIAEGELPGYLAFLVFLLPFIKPVIFKLLDFSGHDELLVLTGIVLALGLGSEFFNFIGLKAELGALLVGVLLSGHSKADELSNSLFSIKEFFLVGFFLSIGLSSQLSIEAIVIALLLCLLLPFKAFFYFWITNFFAFRTRTSLFTSLSLMTYSEFALIVGAISVNMQLIPFDWLVVIAVSVSLSFAFAAPFTKNCEKIYEIFKQTLPIQQAENIHPDDTLVSVGKAKALVIGMGRVGVGAYDELRMVYGDEIVGIEHNATRVKALLKCGRKVLNGDADDLDFWLNLKNNNDLELVVLTMPKHHSNLAAANQINQIQSNCKVSAVVRFGEEERELADLGVTVFNIYSEAGAGLVKHSLKSDI